MSIISNIAKGLTNAEKFLLSLITDAQKVQKIYAALSTGVIAAASAVFYDVVKTIAAAEGAAVAAETGNIPLTIELSSTTLALVKKAVADFNAGEAKTVADFKALNISLTPAAPAGGAQ